MITRRSFTYLLANVYTMRAYLYVFFYKTAQRLSAVVLYKKKLSTIIFNSVFPQLFFEPLFLFYPFSRYNDEAIIMRVKHKTDTPIVTV